jgi:hypothetical protein
MTPHPPLLLCGRQAPFQGPACPAAPELTDATMMLSPSLQDCAKASSQTIAPVATTPKSVTPGTGSSGRETAGSGTVVGGPERRRDRSRAAAGAPTRPRGERPLHRAPGRPSKRLSKLKAHKRQ